MKYKTGNGGIKEILLDALRHIDPRVLTYQDWYQVGMALKHEGLSVSAWDEWSRQDASRYHAGECARKWESYQEHTDKPVTGGTLIEMARRHGCLSGRRQNITVSCVKRRLLICSTISTCGAATLYLTGCLDENA